jgi:alkyl hydroperoxide reductase subunit AhpF
MIGAKPSTAWLSDMVELDKNGFVLTGVEASTGLSVCHLASRHLRRRRCPFRIG